MKLVATSIAGNELSDMAKKGFGSMVKAVVDVKKRIMVIDASLHADEEAHLIAHGSKQDDLWGINIYPELTGDDFIEFDSMINLRPNRGNTTRSVDSPHVQKQIRNIVLELVK